MPDFFMQKICYSSILKDKIILILIKFVNVNNFCSFLAKLEKNKNVKMLKKFSRMRKKVIFTLS